MIHTSKQSKLITNSNTIEVEIGLADTKKAIELLYSQYRFPIQTCVQELVSNAFDAMLQADNVLPIEVQLPNELNDNTFYVRDFGNSMTDDVIKNIYMRVNASTKDKDNKFIGGRGIGSKTPWAYTDTFILTTFLDNIETQYLLVKGRSTVSIIHKGETKEANGTKVTFQTKPNDRVQFEYALTRVSLCATVKPKVNTKNSFDFDNINKINNVISIVKSNLLDTERLYFNIGGILYQMSRHQEFKDCYNRIQETLNNSTLIINMPIGSIEPLQTREGLFTNQEQGQANKSMTKSILKQVEKWVEVYIKNELSNVTTVENAIQLYTNSLFKVKQTFNIEGLSLTNRGINLKLDGKVSEITRESKRGRYYGKNKTARNDQRDYITYKNINKSLAYFCEESPNKARLCSRLREICVDNDVTVLEKSKLTIEAYNTLKRVTNATDVMLVEIPKTIRAASNRGYSVDKNKVATYDCYGKRAYIDYFLNIDYSEHKIVVLEKGEGTRSMDSLLKSLGYTTTYVTKSKMAKLLEKEGFFREEHAIDYTEIAKQYGLYLAKKTFGYNYTINNKELLEKCLSKNKASLLVIFESTCNFNYGLADVVDKIKLEYPEVIERTKKLMIRKYYRGYLLSKKVPLFKAIDDYNVSDNIMKDLTEYVTQKVGV